MQEQRRPGLTDEKLLELLKVDDARAFEAIYNRYFQRLYAHAYKIVGDADRCKDILQEIFIQLWNKRHSQDIKALGPYLYAATRFQVFKILRTTRSYEDLDNSIDKIPGFSHADNLFADKDLTTQLYAGVASLPEKCRTVFQLSRMEQLSNAEIAARLSIAPKTVENQLTIAFRKLRLTLKDYLPLLF
jgi:RNA polymerase sigma-70 factor (family 1)